MKVSETSLPGVLVIEPRVHADGRGFFFESHHARRYADAGVGSSFVQTNVSKSTRGVLRGLHYQLPGPQGKLVTVLDGDVFDVAVDIRTGSPTHGRWTAVMLTARNHRQLWIPEGFAHGFCVTSESATFLYQCTALYDPTADRAIAWDDPTLAIDWPVSAPSLSAKDARAPTLAELSPRDLPIYAP
ncbi:dTDP-4-dehydrorhamnose 3,5-epimerase [Luteibacter yeojuensis]|uniref:dTDP-4-dehydrorhamnose 3,5-epimerase n=1 Tax=Luteibacter yeojuensis TaxID=345309 RepID=A0A0F3KNI1_9GAMM|nr:dTDP-4-dehydrorhamnose 3,5-epimerase [Luteibacter yeojuensis]KJV31654.1 dTDP-4-dehydrorhamnose 3,5-epimerase [Luteibacter yeojuensis]